MGSRLGLNWKQDSLHAREALALSVHMITVLFHLTSLQSVVVCPLSQQTVSLRSLNAHDVRGLYGEGVVLQLAAGPRLTPLVRRLFFVRIVDGRPIG